MAGIQSFHYIIITKIGSNEETIPEDTAFWNLDTLQFKHSNNRIKIQVKGLKYANYNLLDEKGFIKDKNSFFSPCLKSEFHYAYILNTGRWLKLK
jgi:hypothetical protein